MASQGVTSQAESLPGTLQVPQGTTGRPFRRRQFLSGAGALSATSGLSLLPLGGCGVFSPHDPTGGDPTAHKRRQVVPFSLNNPDQSLPVGWQPTKLWRTKRRTRYETTRVDGTTVVQANADRSASGIECVVGIDPDAGRRLRWRWQATRLIPGSDVGIGNRDDCVARLAIAMDGDYGKFSFRDMLFREQASLFAGMDLPYATLIYVWDRVRPVGTMICLNETSRIRYLVVESGEQGLNQWREYDRDLHADMQRVFEEAPGRVIRVGITTDSNNLGTTASATFGDISIDAS